MTSDERIDGINQARTYGELNQAMHGFLEEAEARYPALEQAGELRTCIGGGAFTQAIQSLKQYQALTGERYPEAHRVVEAAAAKHAQLGGAAAGDAPQ
jgi:hypothetical protein